MELVLSLAGVLAALLLGAMSPGPSLVLVARTAMVFSRRDGLFAALAMGVGGFIFAVLALLGLQAVLAGVPRLHLILKIAGGLYLLYLAVCMWRGARQESAITRDGEEVESIASNSFLIALFTQLSNPKTALIYGSIFSALLPADMPLSAVIALPFLIFLIESGWYSVVALALSAPASQTLYLHSKARIDQVAGAVIGLLGVKLLMGARS